MASLVFSGKEATSGNTMSQGLLMEALDARFSDVKVAEGFASKWVNATTSMNEGTNARTKRSNNTTVRA